MDSKQLGRFIDSITNVLTRAVNEIKALCYDARVGTDRRKGNNRDDDDDGIKPEDSEEKQPKKVKKDPQDTKRDRQQREKYKDAPKKPKSGYLIMTQQLREKVLQAKPDLSMTEVSKVMGKKWESMSKEQKDKYQKKAEQDKIRYERQLSAYKKKHPDYSPKNKKHKRRKQQKPDAELSE